MHYYQYTFSLIATLKRGIANDASSIEPTDWMRDLLAQQLADWGFESFETNSPPALLNAFISADTLSTLPSELAYTRGDLLLYGFTWHFERCFLPSSDWLKNWREEVFSPIFIDERLCITTPSSPIPSQPYQYLVQIEAYNAFGSGEHETTSMILKRLLAFPPRDCRIVDMGCGTGILSILAWKLGAQSLYSIDISSDCVCNTEHNFQLNGYLTPGSIHIHQGTALLLDELLLEPVDLLLANIHRNVLIADLPIYVRHVRPGGEIWLSGFMREDCNAIESVARTLNLEVKDRTLCDEWVLLCLLC